MKEQMEAVKRMQNYIQAHLFEEITPAALAKCALFSPWYARKLFLRWTGVSPAEYARKLRLRASALRLRDENARVLDVALDLGFQSVDGYQRAFLREFGLSPKEYARSPIPIPLFTPYGVNYNRSERKETPMCNFRTVFVTRVTRPERKVILKRGKKATEYMSYCEEVGCDVWGLLTSVKSVCGEPVCLWLPDQYVLPGTSVYVQGVEVAPDDPTPVPEGFDTLLLPACEYLLFQGEPFAEEDFEEAIQEIWNAEKKYDPTRIGLKWDGQNPRIQLEPVGSRGYMELMPVCPAQ